MQSFHDSRSSVPHLPQPVSDSSVPETRAAKEVSRSRIFVASGILLGLLLIAASVFVWTFVSQRQQFELIDVSSLADGEGSTDNPTRIKIGKTYKVLLRKDEQYYWKTSLNAGKYRIIEDVCRADHARSNLLSSLSIVYPRRSTPEEAFSFNEVDTIFRKTNRFSLTAPSELSLTLSNHTEDTEFFLTIQKESDTRIIPFSGEILPPSLKLDEKGTGFLKRYDSAFYRIELEKGNYVAEWELTNSENRKTNIQGYLALLDSDGGSQRSISEMNEVDVTSKKSVPLKLRQDTTVILRIQNHHGDVDYVLHVKRTPG